MYFEAVHALIQIVDLRHVETLHAFPIPSRSESNGFHGAGREGASQMDDDLDPIVAKYMVPLIWWLLYPFPVLFWITVALALAAKVSHDPVPSLKAASLKA
jgi:hypothetical protein